MGKRTCSVEGCNKPHDSHGLCRSHCSRWKQHGDPLAGGKPRIVGDTVARFWSRVDKTGDCWVWTGQINSNGYGVLYAGNRMTLAHRFAYEMLVESIPEGLGLDHLCRVRHCVNPEHLEAVTQGENVRRGDAGKARTAQNLAKEYCSNGHRYDELNTYVTSNGWRRCRACGRDATRRYYARQQVLGR